MPQRAAVIAAALWWGSLTAVGAWVVPLLFTHLPTPAQAGATAARLFSAQTWVALACGAALLGISRRDGTSGMNWAGGALAFVLGGMLLALVGEVAVAPRIVARQNLALWHAVGSALYLGQWCCAGAVLWKLSRPGVS